MSKNDVPIPEENLTIYKLLFAVEVALRELIIHSMELICGSHWWKKRLPADILEEYRKGREYERNIKWCQLVPHHPIYYLEFPSLKKIIERRDNWRDVFLPIFKRKDILVSTLSELEPIRNKIAHNRKATVGDLRVVQGACGKLAASIGKERFWQLTSSCTLAPDIPTTLPNLQIEAKKALECCTAYRPLKEMEVWKNIKDKWWFDESYLGCGLNSIREYFELLSAYSELSRSRGTGHEIEAWVKSSNLKQEYTRAEKQLAVLFDDLGGG